jgi:hypothetical protein
VNPPAPLSSQVAGLFCGRLRGGLAWVSVMDETQQQDEAARRPEDCLAKTAYLKWAASFIGDKELNSYYTRLSSEWEKEAQNKSPDHVGRG